MFDQFIAAGRGGRLILDHSIVTYLQNVFTCCHFQIIFLTE